MKIDTLNRMYWSLLAIGSFMFSFTSIPKIISLSIYVVLILILIRVHQIRKIRKSEIENLL